MSNDLPVLARPERGFAYRWTPPRPPERVNLVDELCGLADDCDWLSRADIADRLGELAAGIEASAGMNGADLLGADFDVEPDPWEHRNAPGNEHYSRWRTSPWHPEVGGEP